jgi:hypothetical protein
LRELGRSAADRAKITVLPAGQEIGSRDHLGSTVAAIEITNCAGGRHSPG